MKIRMAIPKKQAPVSEVVKQIPRDYMQEVEIDFPLYDIIKALNITIDENTKGSAILDRINQLKSNEFNRIKDIKYTRKVHGTEYIVVLDAGVQKIAMIFYIGMAEMCHTKRFISDQVENMREEIMYKYNILLNKTELEAIKDYVYKKS